MPSPSRPRWARTRSASARTRSSGGSTALLHDFDYEIHPTLDKHPQDGAPILREEGYPEEVIEGVLSHALAPRPSARHAAEEDAVRLRRARRLRPRVRPRPARRDRDARAEVGQEEAQAAVVRRRREPPGRLRGRRGARGRARRAHRASSSRRCARSRASWASYALEAGATRRSSSSSLVHQPHETRSQPSAGNVAHEHALLVEALDHLARVAFDRERDERALPRSRHHFGALRDQLAAACGHLRSALEPPVGRDVERCVRARPAPAAASSPSRSARRPLEERTRRSARSSPARGSSAR